jgi:hypothetical protein
MKYAIGTQVVMISIREDTLNSDDVEYYRQMYGCKGEIINYGTNLGDDCYIVELCTGDIKVWLREEDVKEYKPKIEQKHYNIENLHIIVNHRAVIVIDTNTKKKGVAKCHPDDKFDFKVGLALAMERMNKQKEYQLIQMPLQGFGGTLYYYDKR